MFTGTIMAWILQTQPTAYDLRSIPQVENYTWHFYWLRTSDYITLKPYGQHITLILLNGNII